MEDAGKRLRKRLSEAEKEKGNPQRKLSNPNPNPNVTFLPPKHNSIPNNSSQVVDPLKYFENNSNNINEVIKGEDPLKFVSEHSSLGKNISHFNSNNKTNKCNDFNLKDDTILKINIENKNLNKDGNSNNMKISKNEVSHSNKPKSGFINYEKYDYVNDLDENDLKKLDQKLNNGIEIVNANFDKEKEIKVSSKITEKAQVIEKKVSVFDRIKNLEKNIDKNQINNTKSKYKK